MHKPNFRITSSPKVISVRLSGPWTTSTDLAYLTMLADTINQMRSGTWGIIVDMRDWQIDQATMKENNDYPVNIDRRNQVAEAWIVNDIEQATHLDKFFEHLPFSPERVQTREALETWAKNHSLPLTEPYF